MLRRADLVFIVIVEEKHFDSWPFFRVIGKNAGQYPDRWKPLRRRIKVAAFRQGVRSPRCSEYGSNEGS